MTIEIYHWEDVAPFKYKAPTSAAITFNHSERFQVIAVEDEERIVGRWRFSFWQPGCIDSWHTWVAGRLRGQGIARRMWLAGVERWQPVLIEAGAISRQGAALLARMTVELVGRVEIKITNQPGDGWLDVYREQLGKIGLREVVRLRRQAAAPSPTTKPALEVVA